jgi:hypothetical protein
VVKVEDANNNTVTSNSDAITLTIASQPGTGATLSCSNNPLTASSGVAAFAGCKIVGTIGSYTLTATDGLLAQATSNSFSITVGVASQLLFTTQPLGGVNEGTAFATEPKVTVEDSGGNVETTDTGTVALAVGSYTAGNGGTTQGTLGCTANSVNAVAGVATFANCKITGTAGAGTYTLSATRTGLTSGTSSGVSITAGTGTQLAITSAPLNIAPGTSATNAFTTTLEDANGNATTNASAITVNLSSSTPSGGTAKFAATSNGASISSVSLPANTQSVTAYYAYSRANQSPVITVSVSGGNPSSDTQTESTT